MGLFGSLALFFIKLIVYVWGFLTNWIYSTFSNPGLVRKNYEKIRSKPTRPIQEGDTEATFVPCSWQKTPFGAMFEQEKFETLADIWDWSCHRYANKKLLGTREVLEDKEETQTNGKILRKQVLGEYKWMTYSETDDFVDNVGRGLRVLGQQPDQNICIFADTSAKWLISAEACFRQSFPVVTIYTSLGLDGVLHGLGETEVEMVITSHELLPKFRTLLQDDKVNVKTIIYMENPVVETDTTGFKDGVQILSFSDVVSLGKNSVNSNFSPVRPTPETPAIIMYTSGSTGTPKGVVLTHKNLAMPIASFIHVINPQPQDLYIAYLPIAHVFEMIGENIMVAGGAGIGYSHPNTLLDSSSMVKAGCSGDATVLKPTIMFCVPLVLDRLYKGITQNIQKKTEFLQGLMEFCIHYKTECGRRGEITPIMDKLIFGKIHHLVGGRLRQLIAGGAPLSGDTHNFLRTVLGIKLQQGYGLTETAACATAMDDLEHNAGTVGPPLEGTHLKLVDWEEGNYRVTDKPYPRGEIVIGGDNVAKGYFKLEEKTKEEFFMDENNIRWFKTGDIGQIEQDGTVRMIDRKKDLVKLQLGEYVSLGKVESYLKGCPVVANVCVFGDSMKSHVVALICPQPEILTELALSFDKQNLNFEDLCNDEDITQQVLKEVINHGKKAGLQKFEIPAAITLTSLEWTPNTGLTTAAMKLKRLPIKKHYQESLDKMYAQ